MKTDKKTIAIIVMGIIILVGAGVYAYAYVENNGYNLGFQDATLLMNQQVIFNLMQNGYITIYVPYQNTSIPIKLVPLQEYSEGNKE